MKPTRSLRPLASCIFASCIEACVLALPSQPALAQDDPVIRSGQTVFTVAAGWEHLVAGDVRLGGKYDYNLSPISLVEMNEQHDGNFDGVRMDVAFHAPARPFGSPHDFVSLRGFYARHDDSTTLNCASSSSAASCDDTSLFDPSVIDNNSLGIGVGEIATYQTDRAVQHWGAAFEVAPADAHTGNLQHRLGIGYRAINQDMDLTSAWSATSNRQQYEETLNTGYLGAYWAVDGHQALGDGLQLIFAGEAGVYWAGTDYRGTMTQTDFAGTFSQALKLDRDEAAFIGALNLAIEKQFQTFTLAGFVRGEYYSYAPQMAYNQTDLSTTFPSGYSISGPNDRTRIDDTDAWSFMIGAAVSVPLGSAR